eukprot:16168172-Heterocapsa_arctica.AAC.1
MLLAISRRGSVPREMGLVPPVAFSNGTKPTDANAQRTSGGTWPAGRSMRKATLSSRASGEARSVRQ